MNRYLRLTLFCLALLPLFATAQDAFPYFREFNQAVAKGTRTYTGQPGPKYWINRADYQIKAAIEPFTRELQGEATISYTNQSPDTLKQVVLKLHQDIFKRGGVRSFQVADSMLHDGVTLYYVRLGDKEIDLNQQETTSGRYRRYNSPPPPVRRNGTNLILQLPTPLAPGQSLSIETAWSFRIPKGFNFRMGTYGDKTFFVAYWYPQVSVYDDIAGWDVTNYTGNTEMYNDFHNYEVSIMAPASTAVWATGEWQNPGEVLQEKALAAWQKAGTSDEVFSVFSADEMKSGAAVKPGTMHTWKFSAKNVPDFAFALSDQYAMDATSIEVEPGRRVRVQAAYNPENKFYDQAAKIARESVKDLSTGILAWPYPYPSITVFNGAGGMEFPMIVNDGAVRDLADLIDLTYHEIAHTYFPFYLGTNERRYAWMDEGWASILPNDMIRKMVPDVARDPMWRNAISYQAVAGTAEDQSLMTLTENTGNLYSIHAYSKPALAYHYLRELLGDDLFRKGMQEYIRRWNGKHPTPYDFFHTLNTATGQDLGWYWKPWFFETKTPDLALSAVAAKGKSLKATITNKGGLPLPVYLTVTYEDGRTLRVNYPASVWKAGNATFEAKFAVEAQVKSIDLGGELVPDVAKADNTWSAK